MFPFCSQVNVIHTANPVEHANHIAAQPQFVHPVHHTFVDLSGHNLANPHPFSGKNSQSLQFSCGFLVLKWYRGFWLQRGVFPELKLLCCTNNLSSYSVLFCSCPGREGISRGLWNTVSSLANGRCTSLEGTVRPRAVFLLNSMKEDMQCYSLYGICSFWLIMLIWHGYGIWEEENQAF